jgi:hypothetical protein
MKSSLLPPVRVPDELRAAAESVLAEGETLSAFIQESVARAVEVRRVQAEFHARGDAARSHDLETGRSHAAADVIAELRSRLERKRQPVG